MESALRKKTQSTFHKSLSFKYMKNTAAERFGAGASPTVICNRSLPLSLVSPNPHHR